jgi:hypothetical protein
MDLSSPGGLFTSLIIGLLGMAMIMYAKRAEKLAPFIGGAAMCVFPYFVHGLLLTWLLAGACLAGTWALSRYT